MRRLHGPDVVEGACGAAGGSCIRETEIDVVSGIFFGCSGFRAFDASLAVGDSEDIAFVVQGKMDGWITRATTNIEHPPAAFDASVFCHEASQGLGSSEEILICFGEIADVQIVAHYVMPGFGDSIVVI